MNDSDDLWTKPTCLLAAGAALGLVLAGLLWGISWFWPSLCAGLGFLAAGVFHGTVSGAVAGWFSGFAFYGGSVIIVCGSVTVAIRAVEQVKKKPFYATVIIMAACQTFLLDMVKDLWTGDKLTKWLAKASTALLFAIAVALWARGGWRYRTSAVIVFCLMPTLVLSSAALPNLNLGVREAINHVSAPVWYAMSGFVCFAAAAMVLGKLLNHED